MKDARGDFERAGAVVMFIAEHYHGVGEGSL